MPAIPYFLVVEDEVDEEDADDNDETLHHLGEEHPPNCYMVDKYLHLHHSNNILDLFSFHQVGIDLLFHLHLHLTMRW